MMKPAHRRIYFLIGGCSTVMIILVGLFVWRYQTLNVNVAQPAVCTRRLRLPAKVVLNQTTVVLEKLETKVTNGRWRVRLVFKRAITKQNLQHIRIQIAQHREGSEVANEQLAVMSRDKKVLTLTDTYYSQAKYNRVVMTTLPRVARSQNLVQIVTFKE
ncbi:hypothetical protein [Lacticaseibacillus rhamnosus]|uniref:hypothetical protein n=1 Tax=Lacticaseibacillus rhamnosus TaxID=47715 RepID=UPI001BA90EE8|nr:hypothetical protein [Lacticaseibacillus rhamnosus]QUH16992.1 hypothetical protein KAW33_13380 [Lacticaseibacillus rhamnosus]QUS95922.1 hypothetical protein KFU59_13385 [Lacticaseibacillus rhamnosus]